MCPAIMRSACRVVGAAFTSADAVIAGVAASAMHGARWVDDDVPVELIATVRRQRGLIVRRETLHDDEIMTIAGIRVTTPARTVFDLGRHLSTKRAVERIDALMKACPVALEDVALIANRHAGARGMRQLRVALSLADAGAESPPETRLRLLFINAGLPRPTTQFVVYDRPGSTSAGSTCAGSGSRWGPSMTASSTSRVVGSMCSTSR